MKAIRRFCRICRTTTIQSRNKYRPDGHFARFIHAFLADILESYDKEVVCTCLTCGNKEVIIE